MTPDEHKAQRLAERAATYRERIAELRAIKAQATASDDDPEIEETP